MNKKGEVSGMVGGLLLLAISLLVGVVLIQASADNIYTTTNQVTINQTLVNSVTNNTVQYITTIRQLDSPVVYNQTNGVLISSGNYTITSNVPYNGGLVVSVLPLNQSTPSLLSKWVITGTGTPVGYISDSGGRAMSNIIILLSCVALVAVAAVWAMKAYNGSD